MTIVTLNKVDEKHLAEVIKIAKEIGHVKVRAYYDGEIYYCMEGSHRVEAAKRLGIPLILEEIGWDDEMETDVEDAEGYKLERAPVSVIWETVYGDGYHGGIYFESDFVSVEVE